MMWHAGSCSCTNCAYSSHAQRTSVQQLVSDGTRIDKLFYGKYIPLRESKVLEKLVRTRAVYDDVRSRTLSTNGSSGRTRSSTRKKMSELSDRGEIWSSNTSKISSCCNCCSCQSFKKIKQRIKKHPYVSKHSVPYENISKYKMKAEKRAKARRRRLGSKISGKMRASRFNVKHIRSDSCYCTASLLKLSVTKHRSKENAEIRTRAKSSTELEFKQEIISRQKLKTNIESKFKIKNDSLSLFRARLKKTRSRKGKKHDSESNTPRARRRRKNKIQHKLSGTNLKTKSASSTSNTKSSKAAIKMKSTQNAQQKPKRGKIFSQESQVSSRSETVDKISQHRQNQSYTSFSITTPSISKSKLNQTHKKSIMKPDSMGIKSTYSLRKKHTERDLERCFCTLALQKNKRSTSKSKSKKTMASAIVPRANKKEQMRKTQTKSDVSHGFAAPVASTLSLLPYECEPYVCIPDECDPYDCLKKITARHDRDAKKHKHTKQSTSTFTTQGKTNSRHEKIQRRNRNYYHTKGIETHKPKKNNTKVQIVRSNKTKTTNTAALWHKCLCKFFTKDESKKKIGTLTSSEKYDHLPLTYNGMRNSLRSESQPLAREKKVTSPNSPNRQAVRIGSNISFNIEFYKERFPDDSKSDIEKDTRFKKHEYVAHPQVSKRTRGSYALISETKQMGMYTDQKIKRKNIFVGSAIKKCLCTLKFHKKGRNAKVKEKHVLFDKETKTALPALSLFGPNSNISEIKIRKISKDLKHNVIDYECPPGICIPDECDPYKCYEIIKKREKKRYRDRNISTERRKMRSVMSMSSSEYSSSINSRGIQSNTIRHTKHERSVNKKLKKMESSPSRQAVRIGSNFSFSIDFYKGNPVSPLQEQAITTMYNTVSHIKDTNEKNLESMKDRWHISDHHLLQVRSMDNVNSQVSQKSNILKNYFCSPFIHKTDLTMNQETSAFHSIYPVTQFAIDTPPFLHKKLVKEFNSLTRFYTTTEKIQNKFVLNKIESMVQLDTIKRRGIEINHSNNKYFGYNKDSGNIQSTESLSSPFYRSYYALNFKISQVRKKSQMPVLEDDECEPDFCVPYECDKAECLKRLKNRFKIWKQTETDLTNTRAAASMTIEKPMSHSYSQADKKSVMKVFHPSKKKKHFGSSIKLNMSAYTRFDDTNLTAQQNAEVNNLDKYENIYDQYIRDYYNRPVQRQEPYKYNTRKRKSYRPSCYLDDDDVIAAKYKARQGGNRPTVMKTQTQPVLLNKFSGKSKKATNIQTVPTVTKSSYSGKEGRHIPVTKAKSIFSVKSHKAKNIKDKTEAAKIHSDKTKKLRKMVKESKSDLEIESDIKSIKSGKQGKSMKFIVEPRILEKSNKSGKYRKSIRYSREVEGYPKTIYSGKYRKYKKNPMEPDQRQARLDQLDLLDRMSRSTYRRKYTEDQLDRLDRRDQQSRSSYASKHRKLINIRTDRASRIARTRPSKMPEELEKFLAKRPRRRVYTIGSNINFSMQFYKEDDALALKGKTEQTDAGSGIVKRIRCFCTRSLQKESLEAKTKSTDKSKSEVSKKTKSSLGSSEVNKESEYEGSEKSKGSKVTQKTSEIGSDDDSESESEESEKKENSEMSKVQASRKSGVSQKSISGKSVTFGGSIKSDKSKQYPCEKVKKKPCQKTTLSRLSTKSKQYPCEISDEKPCKKKIQSKLTTKTDKSKLKTTEKGEEIEPDIADTVKIGKEDVFKKPGKKDECTCKKSECICKMPVCTCKMPVCTCKTPECTCQKVVCTLCEMPDCKCESKNLTIGSAKSKINDSGKSVTSKFRISITSDKNKQYPCGSICENEDKSKNEDFEHQLGVSIKSDKSKRKLSKHIVQNKLSIKTDKNKPETTEKSEEIEDYLGVSIKSVKSNKNPCGKICQSKVSTKRDTSTLENFEKSEEIEYQAGASLKSGKSNQNPCGDICKLSTKSEKSKLETTKKKEEIENKIDKCKECKKCVSKKSKKNHVCTCEMPVCTCEMPVCTCKMPECTCKMPECTCKMPDCTCIMPDCTCKMPDCTCKMPECICKMPDCTCKMPVCTCKMPNCKCKKGKQNAKFRRKSTKDNNDELSTKSDILKYDKSTLTKDKRFSKSLYECEPNVCTPDLCDPKVCFRIFKSKRRFKNTSMSATREMKSKAVQSAPSGVKRCFCILKLQNRQTKSIHRKLDETLSDQDYKKIHKNEKIAHQTDKSVVQPNNKGFMRKSLDIAGLILKNKFKRSPPTKFADFPKEVPRLNQDLEVIKPHSEIKPKEEIGLLKQVVQKKSKFENVQNGTSFPLEPEIRRDPSYLALDYERKPKSETYKNIPICKCKIKRKSKIRKVSTICKCQLQDHDRPTSLIDQKELEPAVLDIIPPTKKTVIQTLKAKSLELALSITKAKALKPKPPSKKIDKPDLVHKTPKSQKPCTKECKLTKIERIFPSDFESILSEHPGRALREKKKYIPKMLTKKKKPKSKQKIKPDIDLESQFEEINTPIRKKRNKKIDLKSKPIKRKKFKPDLEPEFEETYMPVPKKSNKKKGFKSKLKKIKAGRHLESDFEETITTVSKKRIKNKASQSKPSESEASIPKTSNIGTCKTKCSKVTCKFKCFREHPLCQCGKAKMKGVKTKSGTICVCRDASIHLEKEAETDTRKQGIFDKIKGVSISTSKSLKSKSLTLSLISKQKGNPDKTTKKMSKRSHPRDVTKGKLKKSKGLEVNSTLEEKTPVRQNKVRKPKKKRDLDLESEEPETPVSKRNMRTSKKMDFIDVDLESEEPEASIRKKKRRKPKKNNDLEVEFESDEPKMPAARKKGRKTNKRKSILYMDSEVEETLSSKQKRIMSKKSGQVESIKHEKTLRSYSGSAKSKQEKRKSKSIRHRPVCECNKTGIPSIPSILAFLNMKSGTVCVCQDESPPLEEEKLEVNADMDEQKEPLLEKIKKISTIVSQSIKSRSLVLSLKNKEELIEDKKKLAKKGKPTDSKKRKGKVNITDLTAEPESEKYKLPESTEPNVSDSKKLKRKKPKSDRKAESKQELPETTSPGLTVSIEPHSKKSELPSRGISAQARRKSKKISKWNICECVEPICPAGTCQIKKNDDMGLEYLQTLAIEKNKEKKSMFPKMGFGKQTKPISGKEEQGDQRIDKYLAIESQALKGVSPKVGIGDQKPGPEVPMKSKSTKRLSFKIPAVYQKSKVGQMQQLTTGGQQFGPPAICPGCGGQVQFLSEPQPTSFTPIGKDTRRQSKKETTLPPQPNLPPGLEGLCPMCLKQNLSDLCTCIHPPTATTTTISGKNLDHICECSAEKDKDALVETKKSKNNDIKGSAQSLKGMDKGAAMQFVCSECSKKGLTGIFSSDGQNYAYMNKDVFAQRVCPECSKKGITGVFPTSEKKRKSRKSFDNTSIQNFIPALPPLVDQPPMFNMVVDARNMKVRNKEEIYAHLGVGCEDKLEGRHLRPLEEGEIPPPVIDLVIDRDNARVLRPDDVMRTLGGSSRRKYNAPRIGTATQPLKCPWCNVVHDTLPTGTVPTQQLKDHDEHCNCCICSKTTGKGGSSTGSHPKNCTCCICRLGCRYGQKSRQQQQTHEPTPIYRGKGESIAKKVKPGSGDDKTQVELKSNLQQKGEVKQKGDVKQKGEVKQKDDVKHTGAANKRNEKHKSANKSDVKQKGADKSEVKQKSTDKSDVKQEDDDEQKEEDNQEEEEKKKEEDKKKEEEKKRKEKEKKRKKESESMKSTNKEESDKSGTKGKKDTKPVKKPTRLEGTVSKFATSLRNTLRPSCYCGQKICDKEQDKIMKRKMPFLHIGSAPPPCVCGSEVCKKKYMSNTKYFKDLAKKKAYEQKQKEDEEKRIFKASIARIEKYKKDDAKFRKRVKRQDEKAMKELDKYIDDTSGIALFAENAADIGRFGINQIRRLMTSVKRSVRHPTDICTKAKMARRNPRAAAREALEDFQGSGFSGTAARVRHRCAAMQTSKYLVASMESNPITNFLVHFRDKDPKQRLLKRRPEKQPESYECSTFLTSLRKKPCLWLYHLCPWFYPHCLGLLSFWRQFTDLILFILAVGVWSPCILMTELCRTLLCCVMCAGGG